MLVEHVLNKEWTHSLDRGIVSEANTVNGFYSVGLYWSHDFMAFISPHIFQGEENTVAC